jgi:16S rRNA (guanine(966)-N(2))-methyltransferase RsmD
MRVIAGSLKGRRLKSPDWTGLRPTSDRLRETIFDVLATRLDGAHVLDGFAGTGALGIEALSRGARHVTFVDRDRRAQELIVANLEHCRIENGYTVLCASVADTLERIKNDAAFVPFDVILFDPPYDLAAGTALRGADAVLAPGGVLILEHARKPDAPASAGRLVRIRRLGAGDSALTMYSLQGTV